jgi:hypothetical protein
MLHSRSLALRTWLTPLLSALALLGLIACSWPPSIVVVIPALPAQSATLSILVGTGNQQASENPSLDVTAFAGQAYRFGIHPPLSSVGTFSVAVAAFDKSGCLLSTGIGEIELGAADNDGFVYGRPERNLQIPLDASTGDGSQSCLRGSPVIRSFAQSEDDPTQVVIIGWGFAPGVRVQLDGMPALSETRRDATRIEARLAITPTESGLRTAQLLVRNPDTRSASKEVSLYSVAFAPRERSTYSFSSELEPTSIAAGDVNKDGKQDIVVSGLRSGTQGFIGIFLNQGSGKLPAQPVLLEFSRTIDDLQVADLNQDGAVDIAALSASGKQVFVMLNDGAGSFNLAATSTIDLPAVSSPVSLAVGNVLGDGFPDIVVLSNASFASQGMALFLIGTASGLGYVGALSLPAVLFTNVLVRDMDANGRDDLVLAESYAGMPPTPVLGYAQVILSNGDGTFDIKAPLAVAAGYYHLVQAMRLDADALPDVVVSGAFSTTQQPGTVLSVFVNQGAGNFPANRSEFNTSPQPFAMAVGDVNRDGLEDLALTHTFKEGQGRLSMLLNLGGNRGFAPTAQQPSYALGYGDTFVTVGDFSGDGRSDFATVNRGAPKLSQPALLQLFLNTSL